MGQWLGRLSSSLSRRAFRSGLRIAPIGAGCLLVHASGAAQRRPGAAALAAACVHEQLAIPQHARHCAC